MKVKPQHCDNCRNVYFFLVVCVRAAGGVIIFFFGFVVGRENH